MLIKRQVFHLRSKPLRFIGSKVHACDPIMPPLLAAASWIINEPKNHCFREMAPWNVFKFSKNCLKATTRKKLPQLGPIFWKGFPSRSLLSVTTLSNIGFQHVFSFCIRTEMVATFEQLLGLSVPWKYFQARMLEGKNLLLCSYWYFDDNLS